MLKDLQSSSLSPWCFHSVATCLKWPDTTTILFQWGFVNSPISSRGSNENAHTSRKFVVTVCFPLLSDLTNGDLSSYGLLCLGLQWAQFTLYSMQCAGKHAQWQTCLHRQSKLRTLFQAYAKKKANQGSTINPHAKEPAAKKQDGTKDSAPLSWQPTSNSTAKPKGS